MQLRLNQKKALVTGGASGIGFACAAELAREGCDVALWDVSTSVSESASKLHDSFSVQVLPQIVNISQIEQVETALRITEEALGPIEIVVHAAAVSSGYFGFPFTNVPVSAWNKVIEVNILGVTNLAHVVAPRLRERKKGAFVFIASVAGQIGSQTDPPYSASKAANINFAQCMAKDLAPFGVRVNTVCPGMVQTPLNRSVWEAWNKQQPEDARRSYEDWANGKIRNVVPLGRWQQPEDIANLVTFLASDRASEITGQTINVDGGFVMHW